MILDCLADLHGHYPKDLPGGDLLIVAGDLTSTDTEFEYADKFLPWLIDQGFSNYKKVVWIAGNHDNWVQENIDNKNQFSGGEYLCDSGTEFEGLKIWGSPWTKTFPEMNPSCMAFTAKTEEELADKWSLIPDDVDILVTHSPPWGIMDLPINSKKRAGSQSLLKRLNAGNLSPKLHVFGHIHEEYGYKEINVSLRVSQKMKLKSFKCKFANASFVNQLYQPVNKPIRVVI